MNILDKTQFDTYYSIRTHYSRKQQILYEKILPLGLFSFVGAFGWAIRGTQGWGGTAGGIIAGLLWGILFYFLAASRGIDARWQMIHLGVGIGVGGLNGYGQLLGWIHGTFWTGLEYLPINPWIGYIWLLLIGLEWGGTAAIIFSWSFTEYLNRTIQLRYYIIRFFGGIIGGTIGYFLINQNPSIFFPNYSPELYESLTCNIQCVRTAATLPLLGCLFGVFCGMLLVEIILKNRWVLQNTIIMAIGFGIIFPIAAYLFFILPQSSFDWWKIWEESIGFIGGISIGIVYLLSINSINHSTKNQTNVIDTKSEVLSNHNKWTTQIAFSLGLLVFYCYGWSALTHTLVMDIGWLDYVNESKFYPERFILQLVGILPMLIGYLFWFRIQRKKWLNSVMLVENKLNHFKTWIFGMTFMSMCAFVAIQGSNIFYFYIFFYFIIVVLSFKAMDISSRTNS